MVMYPMFPQVHFIFFQTFVLVEDCHVFFEVFT